MAYHKTDLRISTMVITAHWGTSIQLASLFESLRSEMIPIWYPSEGVLKIEHGNRVMGWSHKDIFTNRKISDKTFFNQATLVLRRRIPLPHPAQEEQEKQEEKEKQEDRKEPPSTWKEVNMKLFANGGIQMTGVTSESFACAAIEWLYQCILRFPVSPFAGPVHLHRISIQLINTDYSINRYINQDALHKILINDYNLCSMLEKTIYQGVNTKYFYNTQNTTEGICSCEKICKGQGTGEGEGQCKRITMSIFRTGKIIITGARKMEQIRTAYAFLNRVFDKHHATVLYHPLS